MTRMRDFYQEIIDIIGAGGEACCVIPIGDPAFENAAHTTVTTKGQGALDGLVFTYSEDRRDWTNPTIYIRNQFRTPIVDFDGVGNDATTPDIDAWSRDDASGEPWSIGAAINLKDATSSTIMSKEETTGGLREWILFTSSADKFRFNATDESAGIVIQRLADSAIPENESVLAVATYDGAGGASAMDTVILYLRGLVAASTATNNASYVAMENDTHGPAIGVQDTNFGFFDGKMVVPFFTHRELSAAAVFNLNNIYVAMQREASSWVPRSRF